MALLPIVFPALWILAIFVIFKVRLDDYFDSSEVDYFNNPKNGIKPNFFERMRFLLSWILIGSLCGVAQFAIFKLFSYRPQNTLYFYRFTEFIPYHFLPGLFIGICSAAQLRTYFSAKKGKEYFREFLLEIDTGMTGYQAYIVFLKYITSTIVVISIFCNYIFYNSYIFVDNDKISYSRITSFSSKEMNISDLYKIYIYTERRATNGKTYPNINLELVFKDGSVIDTFNLVSGLEDVVKFLKAINVATHGRVAIEKIEGKKPLF